MRPFDIRLALTWPNHVKLARLNQLCGLPAKWRGKTPGECWIRLLAAVQNHDTWRRDGVLSGLTADQVEQLAGWVKKGKRRGMFVQAMVDVKALDVIAGDDPAAAPTYAVHDWAHHQSWGVATETRREESKLSNEIRATKSRIKREAKLLALKTELETVRNGRKTDTSSARFAAESAVQENSAVSATPDQSAVSAVPPQSKSAVQKVPPDLTLPDLTLPDRSAVVPDRDVIDPPLPPFVLKAETAGLHSKKAVEKALLERWPPATPATETQLVVYKILLEQRVDKSDAARTVEFCAGQLTQHALDWSVRRFVANALYATRRIPRVTSLALYMRGKCSKECPHGEGCKLEPLETQIEEAKSLITKWLAQLERERPKPPQTLGEILSLAGARGQH